MPAQNSTWNMTLFFFKDFILSKVIRLYFFLSLLHEVGKMLDKPLLNQEKIPDAVNNFS
jgi:hypothetical protein